MFDFLRKKLEETVADVNPFDNGRTGATVRAQRPKPAPAQTISQPRPMPSFTSGGNGLTPQIRQQPLSIKTNFNSPNINPTRLSPAAQQRVRQGDLALRKAQSDVYNPLSIVKDVVKAGGDVMKAGEEFVRKGSDGKNFGDNVGGFIANNAAKMVNTANEGFVQPVAGLATGKPLAEIQKNLDKNLYTEKGGLFNAGTFFPTKDDYNRVKSNPLEFAKGFAGAGVATASEVVPVARGTSLLTKPGLSTGQKIIRGAAEGAAYGGAGTAGSQLINEGKLNAGEIAKGAAVGGVLGGAIPAAATGVQKAAPVVRAATDIKAPIHAAAEQVSGLPRVNVLNDNEAFTLADYADAINGRGNISPSVRAQIIPQARNAAKTAGFDITNMSPAEADRTISKYLESRDNYMVNYKQAERQMMQGGYAKVPGTRGTFADDLEPKNTSSDQGPRIPNQNQMSDRSSTPLRDGNAQTEGMQAQRQTQVPEQQPSTQSMIDEARTSFQQDRLPSQQQGKEAQIQAAISESTSRNPLDQRIQQKMGVVKDKRRAINEGANATYGLRDSFDQADNVPNELKQSLGAFGNTRTVKSNKELWSDAQNRMQDPAEAMKFFGENNSDEAVATGYALINKYMKAGQTKEAGDIAMIMAERALESGRQTQAYAMMKKLTPEGSIAYVARKVSKYLDQHPKDASKVKWNEQVQADLYQMADEIAKMPEGRERNLLIGKMQQTIDNIFPSSIIDKAITVWKAGLLTSLRTQERNIVGNTLNNVSEQISTLPGSIADKLMSLRTKQRTLVASTGEGLGKGAKYGAQIAKDQLKTGIDVTDSNIKMNLNHVTWGDNKVEKALEGYTEAVFRTLGASDKVFKESARSNSLYNQAIAQAKTQKLPSSSYDDFIKNRVANPTAKMLDIADNDASRATFTHDNVLGDLVSNGKRALRNSKWGKYPAALADIIVPFTQVPTGVASQLYAYSPAKLLKSMYDVGKVLATGDAELQRGAAQGFGRSVVGTSVIGAGAYLMSQGLMTGQPEDDAEKAQWEAEGKMPNSVKIGDKWYQLGSIGPQTILLLAGGQAVKDAEAGRNPIETTAGNLAKNFKDQTFLKGMSSALDAIDDPKRNMEFFVESQASSVVPNIVKDVAKAIDPNQREARGIPEKFKQSIPGLSQSLPERLDSYGQPMKNRGVGALIDLFNSSKEKDLPEASYVDALRASVGTKEHIPSKADKTIQINGENKKLTSQEYNEYQKYIGTKAKDLISKSMSDPKFLKLSDEDKANNLDNKLKEINSAAKIALFGQSTDNASKSVKNMVKTSEVKVGAKVADSDGLSVDLPDNINSIAASILEDADSADRTDEWKASKTDNKDVKDTLTQWLPNKVDMPDVNKATALKWAQYEKDIASGKLGKIESQDKRKEILKDVFNSRLQGDEKDLHKLSKSRLKDAIDSGLVTDKNIEKALSVEKQMYDAGLLEKRELAQKLGLVASGTGKGKGGKKGSKGKFDYKLFGFSPSGQSNSKQLHDLLKKATMNRPKKHSFVV